MFSTLLPVAVLAGSYAWLVTALIGARTKLPPLVASHFNASGAPDGWSPRDSYLWTMGAIATVMPVVIIGSMYVLRFLGGAGINLPHRDYWLAPERRTETYGVFLRVGIWIASIMVLTFLGAHMLTVAANAANPVILSSDVWWLLVGNVTAIGCLAIWLMRRFRAPNPN